MKVMSFNIRNGRAPDKHNAWPLRSRLFFKAIRDYGPDLLGLQEVLIEQFISAKCVLPEYDYVGVAREDGKEKGEYAPLFYRRKRFALVETGTWWLSPMPHDVASVGWDAALTRIATWTRLRDREQQKRLLVINTHFDHVGEAARVESARLLRERTKDEKDRVIIMGDFNCTDVDPPYRVMIEGGDFLDTFRQINPTPGPNEATFHDFTGNTCDKRIDFIFTRGFGVTAAGIDRTRDGDRCPSDHDAVTATLV